MFGIIADALTTATSVLFPVFASYKAIRTADPAQLIPWLMYWTTLSLFLAGESFFHPILVWTPFYSWIRLGVHLYLVLPGQQGSVHLYRRYLHPYMETHEREIDNFITKSHDRAKRAGLSYIQQALEQIKTKLLGLPPKPPTPPPSRSASYTQTLMSRFAMPTARPVSALSGGANDLLGMLGTLVQQAAASAPPGTATTTREQAQAASLIPTDMVGAERADYISTQQQRLRALLRAFDAAAAPPADSPADLKKSRSEAEFVDLAHEPVAESPPAKEAVSPAGRQGWTGWIWGAAAQQDREKKEQ